MMAAGRSLILSATTTSAKIRYSSAISGTTNSATFAIDFKPPKMIGATMAIKTNPMAQVGIANACSMAWAMELACTLLNASPNAMIRQIENSTASQRSPKPRSM